MFKIGKKKDDNKSLYMTAAEVLAAAENPLNRKTFGGQQWKRIKRLAKQFIALGIA